MKVNDAEYQRVLAIIQDSILLIANVLLSFTDKERKFVIKEALEIATRLTPPKKIKKGKEK